MKMRLKWPKSCENPKKIAILNFPKLSVFVGQKSILRHYYIQNVEDGVQIQTYKIRKESVARFSQFFSSIVEKFLRKSQTQFREKLRKLRLTQNNDFLTKKQRILIKI